jgi:hypothetical protein
MNLEETGALLAKAAGYDNRTIGQGNVLAWHEALNDLRLDDCLQAVTLHHRSSSEYLMPVHIRRLAAEVRRERQERELETERRLELEAYAADAGPLTDRSQEIQEFVHHVRDALPEGDVEALHPRREFWRREHTAYQRQINGEPNPHFDPTMGPIPTWQASKHPPEGAWWEDPEKRERHAKTLLAEAGRLHRPQHVDTCIASKPATTTGVRGWPNSD